MEDFARLIQELDQTTKTNEKIEAMRRYFASTADKDRIWALYFLSGRVPRRQISSTQLREWSAERSGLPLWLVEECYHTVGDLAETMALILPEPTKRRHRSLAEWMPLLQSLKQADETQRKELLFRSWDQLAKDERFVFNKLITGAFRIGVSQKLVIKALALVTTIDENVLAHRLMGDWNPDTTTITELLSASDTERSASQPYPFYLAYQLDLPFEELGAPEEYAAEWKWDGIRGQLIRRHNQIFVWSRGEDLVTDRFPEVVEVGQVLPNGTVLDGEILAWRDGEPLPFANLQTRIGRKTVGKKLLEDSPVVFMAYDLLEEDGQDLRELPFRERRQRLERIVAVTQSRNKNLILSPLKRFPNWNRLEELREEARRHKTEGLFLKKWSSFYQVGRKRGEWWKWKVEPLTIDGVLIYAQKGHGRRADLYTDYTFAVWNGEELVTFAKAYSGLTDEEIREVDAFIRKNTRDTFGPVRTVTAKLVFELGFDSIQPSNRHKSGVAVRFPRILRWRRDKKATEADTLETLLKLAQSQ